MLTVSSVVPTLLRAGFNVVGQSDGTSHVSPCAGAPATATREMAENICRGMPDFVRVGPQSVDSTSDARTVNNTMRHAYRVLSDAEKASMARVKDDGLAFHQFIDSLGASRELSIAKTKVEEAVMWAVKHITA